MKRFLMLMLVATMATLATAIPAKRVQRTVTINGQQVTLTLVGDENLHYWQAPDGTPYQFVDDQRVERFDLTAARENMQMHRTAQMVEMNELSATPNGMQRVSQANRAKYSGTRRGLVILAAFKDKGFSIANTKATYQRVMSEEGYKGNNQYGSVRDYFKAQSYGEFDFVLDVVGPVTLSQNMEYYGGNGSNGSDLRPAHMAREACQLADAMGVDFTPYDWDGDGFVEQVFIIYAGYGEAQGAAAETIWPHAWAIEGSGQTLTLDGKRISSYACGSELRGTSGTNMDGIGTICHEFSHCFGLPDFYCTDYNHSDLTMSYWSLMDHGSYSNNGYTPTAYTAYERWACGWLEPRELTGPLTVQGMQDITTAPDSYILYNAGNRNEYYIMYNVQQKSWNSAAMGHGMMVLHVDYNSTAWSNNKPNNDASHLRMTPICADNERGTSYASSFAGDPFPGTKRNTRLTDTSTPAAKLFNANTDGRKYMGHPIEEITETNGLISFKFDGGVPVPDAPTNVTAEAVADGFTVAWDAMEHAATYDIEYGVYDQEVFHHINTYLSVDFDFGVTSDGSSDISSSMAEAGFEGYSGSKLYKGKKGLKLGSSSAKGFVNTPVLQFATDSVEVTVVASPYTFATASLSFVRLDAEGNILETGKTVTLDKTDNQVVTMVLPTADMANIRIGGPDGRVYIKSISVSDKVNPYGATTTIPGITANHYTVKPTPLADAYYYRVRALNATSMASAWSDTGLLIINELTPPAEPAAVPVGVTAVQDAQSIVVAWSEAANAVAYNVGYRAKEGEWATFEGVLDTHLAINLQSIERHYDVRVQAVNADGVESAWSDVVELELQFPMTTPTLTVTPDTQAESFTITWGEVTNAVAYEVLYAEGTALAEHPTVCDFDFTHSSLTVKPDSLVKHYTAKLIAVNLLGDRVESSEVVVTFEYPTTTPASIDTEIVTSVDAEAFTISWAAVDNAVEYVVEYGTYDNQAADDEHIDANEDAEARAQRAQRYLADESRYNYLGELRTTATTATIQPEQSACAYYVKVAAVNRFGEQGEWSNRQIITYIETAINALAADGRAVIYNLGGQRVNRPTRGLYIIGGVKRVLGF